MRRIVLISSFMFVFLFFASAADQVVSPTEEELNSGTPMTAQVPVTLNPSQINYFETGFITQPYYGKGSPSVSNDVLVLELGDDGYATGSIYVYWVYATSDNVAINLSISKLKSAPDSSGTSSQIDWSVSCNGKTIASADSPEEDSPEEDSPEADSPEQIVQLNDGTGFKKGADGTTKLDITTTESVDGKPAVDYQGTITLKVVEV